MDLLWGKIAIKKFILFYVSQNGILCSVRRKFFRRGMQFFVVIGHSCAVRRLTRVVGRLSHIVGRLSHVVGRLSRVVRRLSRVVGT
jgi:hypothetical protein